MATITREEIVNLYEDEEFVFADGFDDCIIGVAERFGQPSVVSYSKSKIIRSLQTEMSEEEAYEFFHYNILGAYVGERTPIFIDELDD